MKICTEADYLQAHLTIVQRRTRPTYPTLQIVLQRAASRLKKRVLGYTRSRDPRGSQEAEVPTAARMVWPRVAAVVASELKRKGSGREAEALAAEIWEGVLRSVARALQRKSDSGPTIRNFRLYLVAAFHHRFHRFQKSGRGRRDGWSGGGLGRGLDVSIDGQGFGRRKQRHPHQVLQRR
jgi:hypothetical protein